MRRHNNHPSNGVRLKVPSFIGSGSLEEYLEWVEKVKKMFDWYVYTDKKKFKVVTLEFTDYALL